MLHSIFKVLRKLLSLVIRTFVEFYKALPRNLISFFYAKRVFVWVYSELFHVYVALTWRPFFFIFPCRGRSQRKGKVGVLDLQRKQAVVGHPVAVSGRSWPVQAALPGDIPLGCVAARTVHVSHIQLGCSPLTTASTPPSVVSSGDATTATLSLSLRCLLPSDEPVVLASSSGGLFTGPGNDLEL